MKPTMIKDNNNNPVPVLTLDTQQTVDGTSATTQSTVIDATEQCIVRLAALSNLWINIAENPVSVADTCYYLPSGSIEYLCIPKNYKISVLGGKLNIVKCY